MLEFVYDNRVKIYAIFLLALILVLTILAVIRVTNLGVYEDGSWGLVVPVVDYQVTGCFPPMGCLVLDEVLPVEEEWLDSAEYIIGGPLVQDGTVVVSGLNHSLDDATFWNCYHALNLCILRHDDRPLFYRVLPDYPPPGWELIFGPSNC
jgi:hypothetical protein